MEGTFLSRFFSKINAAYPTSGFVYGSKESTPPLHLLCLVALSFLLRSSSNRWTRSGEVVCWPICAILCLSGCPSSRTMFTLTCPRCSLGVTVFVTHQVRILEVKSWLQHYIFLDVLFLMKRADFLSTYPTLTPREVAGVSFSGPLAYMHVTSNLRYDSSRRPQIRRDSRISSYVVTFLTFAAPTY